MATTRLRKAFHYPADSDSDPDSPTELDEEHQERLIASLQASDASKNALYRKAFLSIPALASLFFLYIFLAASNAQERVIALLSLSSLLCTAYILHFMPVEGMQGKGKKPLYQVEAAKSPVEKYLGYLNAALAGLLLVAATVSWRKDLREAAWRECLPAIIFALTMFVRQQLAPVDLEELQKARYEFKGA